MSIVTLTKRAYAKLVERQERTDAAIAQLQRTLHTLSQDEVRAAVAKNLDRQSRLLDAGQGKRFRSMKSFRSFVRGL